MPSRDYQSRVLDYKIVVDWEPPDDEAGNGEGGPPKRRRKAKKSARRKPKSRAGAVYRVALSTDDYDDDAGGGGAAGWVERFRQFLDDPAARSAAGLIVGPWDYEGMVRDGEGAAQIVEALVVARGKLPKLRAVYFGDIDSEECEISWINQTDVAPLMDAYPALEEFRVRGGQGLGLGSLRHKALRSLAVESGGLPAAVVREVGAARLPALERLELWLGTPSYGGDATVDDLKPILSGKRFPKLKTLALKDSAMADSIARAVARSPLLDRIEVLDLSMGNLSDDGAAALLLEEAVPKLQKLKSVYLRHHYVSDWMLEELKKAGLNVVADDAQVPNVWGGEIHRYVEVSE